MSEAKLTIIPCLPVAKDHVQKYIQGILDLSGFKINEKLNKILCKVFNKTEVIEIRLDFEECEDAKKLNQMLLDPDYIHKYGILKTIEKCKIDLFNSVCFVDETESIVVIDCDPENDPNFSDCPIMYEDVLACDYLKKNNDKSLPDLNLSNYFNQQTTIVPDNGAKMRASDESYIDSLQSVPETYVKLTTEPSDCTGLSEEHENENKILNSIHPHVCVDKQVEVSDGVTKEATSNSLQIDVFHRVQETDAKLITEQVSHVEDLSWKIRSEHKIEKIIDSNLNGNVDENKGEEEAEAFKKETTSVALTMADEMKQHLNESTISKSGEPVLFKAYECDEKVDESKIKAEIIEKHNQFEIVGEQPKNTSESNLCVNQTIEERSNVTVETASNESQINLAQSMIETASNYIIEVLFEKPISEDDIDGYIMYFERISKTCDIEYKFYSHDSILQLEFANFIGKTNVLSHESHKFLDNKMTVRSAVVCQPAIVEEVEEESYVYTIYTSDEQLLHVLFKLDESYWNDFKTDLSETFVSFERSKNAEAIELSSKCVNQYIDALNIVKQYLKSKYEILVIPRGNIFNELIRTDKDYFVEMDVDGGLVLYASKVKISELMSRNVANELKLDMNEIGLLLVHGTLRTSPFLNVKKSKINGNQIEFEGRLESILKCVNTIDEILSKKLSRAFNSYDKELIDYIKKDEKSIAQNLAKNKIKCLIEPREDEIIFHAVSDEAIRDCKNFLDASFEISMLNSSNDERVGIVLSLGKKYLDKLEAQFQNYYYTCVTNDSKSLRLIRPVGTTPDMLSNIVKSCLNEYMSVSVPSIENLNEQINENEDFYFETIKNCSFIKGTRSAINGLLETNMNIKIQVTLNLLRFMYVKRVFSEFKELKFDVKQTLISIDGILSEIFKFATKMNSINSSLLQKEFTCNQIIISTLKENEKKFVKSLLKNKINCVIEFKDKPNACMVIADNTNDINKFNDLLQILLK